MFKSKLDDVPLAYSYDDVMLIPQHSTLKSRKEPDVTTKIGEFTYNIPVISSPMSTITELEMMLCMRKMGGSSVLHRYMSIEKQVEICKNFNILFDNNVLTGKPFYVAVGASGDYLERVKSLYDIGIRTFCVDIADGHSDVCVNAVRKIIDQFENGSDLLNIMAGDVCTYEGAYKLADIGCSSIRVGIGCGFLCKTRTVTGHGVPQLSAIEDCARIKERYNHVSIIADGGIKNSGDGVKSLAMGADVLMVGSLLSATEESPGQTLKDEDGNLYKTYSGMASAEARMKYYDKESSLFVPEGVSIKVPFKGSAEKIIENFIGGIKVGMSYSDAHNLKELRENAEWVRITNNGLKESLPATKK